MPSDTVLPCRDTLHSPFLGAGMGLVASYWGLEKVFDFWQVSKFLICNGNVTEPCIQDKSFCTSLFN